MKQHQRQIVVLPTGTGKTVLGLAIAKHIGKRTLWIAHREELITQPYDTCSIVWPEASRGIVKAARNEINAQCVFASVQTIQRKNRIKQLGNFDFVVLDECHHANANSWKQAAENVGCFTAGGPKLLGLTATPERTDNKSLGDIFENIAYVYHLITAVNDGYLVPITYQQRRLNLDLASVKTRRNGDFDETALDAAMLQAGIVNEICAAVQEHAQRKILVFTVSVKQSQEVATKLQSLNILVAEINGETPSEVRRARLRRFKSGDLRCITNCMVLTEGFDEPTVDCIIMARPTTSKPLYCQAIGRGLRISPGKENCLVVDMVGATAHHNLIQAPVLFGSDEDAARETRRMYEFDEDIAEWNERKLLLGQIKGLQSVSRSNMHWVNCDGNTIAISAGRGGTVIARCSNDRWTVLAVKYNDTQLLVDQACLELAQGVAEDYVRRCEASGWVDKGARWRSEPATKKQTDLISRLKIQIKGDLTRGEASDFITQSVATDWRYEPATKKQLAALRIAGIESDKTLTKQQARRLLFGGTK
jgi:superfamily II DNA or RNA helicase